MRKGDKMSRDEYNALKVGLGPSPARGNSTADRGGATQRGTNVPLGPSLSAAEGGRHVRRVHRRVGGRQRKIHRGRCAPTHPHSPPSPSPRSGCGRSLTLTPAIPAGYVEEGGGFNWVNLLYIPVIGGLGVGIVLTLQAIN